MLAMADMQFSCSAPSPIQDRYAPVMAMQQFPTGRGAQQAQPALILTPTMSAAVKVRAQLHHVLATDVPTCFLFFLPARFT